MSVEDFSELLGSSIDNSTPLIIRTLEEKVERLFGLEEERERGNSF